MSEMRKMDEEARHHVLIVEDEVGANALLAAYLLRKGYRVTTAENGTRGFSKFLEDPAHLVISDLKMPGLDGMKLIELIRSMEPTVPVVVASGYVCPLDKAKLEAYGNVEVFKKPIDLRALKKSVDMLLKKAS